MKKKLLFLLICIFGMTLSVKAEVKTFDTFEGYFDWMAPDGVVTIKGIKSLVNDKLTIEKYSNIYFQLYYDNATGGNKLTNCNEDLTVCDLSVYDPRIKEQEGNVKQVKVAWSEEDPEITKMVAEIANKIKTSGFQGAVKSEKNIYTLEDLAYLNYLYMQLESKNGEFDKNKLNYVPKLKELTKYSNITFYSTSLVGDSNVLYSLTDGSVALLYDGVIYGILDRNNDDEVVNIYTYHTIYIPDETENTEEAYRKAAQDRINKYFGKGKIIIGEGTEIKDACNLGCAADRKYTTEQTGGHYYSFTIGDYTNRFFLIVRDSSKMQESILDLKDYHTNLIVNVKDGFVPNDTILKVNKVTSLESTKTIKEKIKNDEFIAYDISLYSDTLGKDITNIDNGSFEVSMPIPENFKNKDLVVYYIKADGSLEDYEVSVKDNYATFTTTHFSQYILAATPKTTVVKPDNDNTNNNSSTQATQTTNKAPNNAQTGTIDVIMLSLVAGLSLVGIVGILVSKKKFN